MEILYLWEHQRCLYCDRSNRPQIETVTFKKGQRAEVFLHANQVVFFTEGTIRHVLGDCPAFENSEGQFIFLPFGGKLSLEAISDSSVMVFNLDKPVSLCEGYSLEKLYEQTMEGYPHKTRRYNAPVGCLYVNEPISHFLESVSMGLRDGIRCRYFVGLKIKELFLMLRAYYPKEQLRDFLNPILSADTAFSESVRANLDKYHTVKQLAASLNITPRAFTAKFKQIFGTTPYSWIKQEKVETVRQQLLAGSKSFKRIAAENGFNTVQQFTNFCKKELGANPSQLREEGVKYIFLEDKLE